MLGPALDLLRQTITAEWREEWRVLEAQAHESMGVKQPDWSEPPTMLTLTLRGSSQALSERVIASRGLAGRSEAFSLALELGVDIDPERHRLMDAGGHVYRITDVRKAATHYELILEGVGS